MRPRSAALLAAAFAVAVAAACRFAEFDLLEFKYDEAQVSRYALDLVRNHIVPQTSILTSGGFHNPPLMVYLTAIPILISPSPLLITGFFAGLNALAGGALYLVSRRFFGDLAALVASLLFAVGPLAVHFSRKIWAPDAMPPFTVLFFAGLALGLGEGQGWWLAPALIALAVLVQLHQAAIVWIPVAALLFILFAHRLNWRRPSTGLGLASGLAGFVVLLLPYGAFEVHHHLADLTGMAGQIGAQPAFTVVPWRDLWWLTAGWNPALFFAPLAAQQDPSLAGSSVVDWAVLTFGLGGAACCLYWLVRPAERPDAERPGARRVVAATLLALTFIPPLVMMRSAAAVYPHYLVFLTPLAFLLVGIGVWAAGAGLGRLAGGPPVQYGVVAVITAGLALTSLLRLTDFDQRLRVHTGGGDYGVPLRYTLRAAEALRHAAPGAPPPHAYVMASGGDFLAVYQYLVQAGIAPPAALVQPDQALPIPATPVGASYLFGSRDNQAFDALQLLNSVSPVEELPGGRPPYTVLSLPASAPDARLLAALHLTPVGPFTVGPGLNLTAAEAALSGPDGPLVVTLAWSIQDPTPFARQPVKVFVHLYDAARHTVAQEDALGYPAAAWRQGDRLITWFSASPGLPLPPGQYTLVAGVYAVQGFAVFPVRGPQGQDLGGEIPLGMLRVRAG